MMQHPFLLIGGALALIAVFEACAAIGKTLQQIDDFYSKRPPEAKDEWPL